MHHSLNGSVEIVREFMKLDGFYDEKAREIFAAKNNIQKIPVVNEEGELIGDYSRWDDGEKFWIDWIMKQNMVWNRLGKYLKGQHQKIYIVEPDRRKAYVRQRIAEKVQMTKAVVRIIKKDQLTDLMQEEEKCLVLTTDLDEYRGIKCLECIEGMKQEERDRKREWTTVSKLYERLEQYDRQERLARYSISSEGDQSGNLLKKLQEEGVHLLLLYNNPYYKSEYIKNFVRKNAENMRTYSINAEEFWPVESEAGKQFFGELLLEKDYMDGTAQKEILQGNKMQAAGKREYKSRYYNVEGGKRKTCYQPTAFYRKVYFFGPCVIIGAYQEDKYTIESWLQKQLCDNRYFYRVENCGSYENSFKVMQNIAFQKGDIAVIWTGSNDYQGIDSIELKQIYEQNHVPAEWCISVAGHMSHKMTRVVADTIYRKIKVHLKDEAIEENLYASEKRNVFFKVENYYDILGKYVQSMYLNRHFAKAESIGGKKGCFVADLDTDPALLSKYTDQIFRYVEELIIFVPNGVIKSKYSFREYISALNNIFKHNPGIQIVSGDKFIPYLDFFQSYYMGDILLKNEAELETQIFAQCIAKPLNLSFRFNLKSDDTRTDAYHEVLKKVLPEFGIEYCRFM